MTRLLGLLAAIAVFALAAPAQGDSAQGDSTQGAGDHGGQHQEKPLSEMEPSELFLPQFKHLEPHALGAAHGAPDPGGITTFYDTNLFQLITLGLMVLVFGLVRMSFASGASGWFIRVFRGWCHWLRDEVIYRVMGEEEGAKFAPFFLYLFFFLAFMNLIGLIPGSVTATASVMVTGAMALVTLVIMVGGGMLKQGAGAYWKHLLPPGLPAWLIPLMVVVEYVGLVVKPFALTIRLFANMLAGHLLIYSFVGMIFVFAKMFEESFVSYLPAVAVIGMGIFIMIIEALVVLLQAYIFMFLSVLFIQEARHPAH